MTDFFPKEIIEETKNKFRNDSKTFIKKYINVSDNEFDLVIKTSLKVEILVDEILRNSLVNPEAIFKNKYRPFSDKIKILDSLGYNKNFLNKLTALNKLRNKFAHNLDYSLTKSDIETINLKNNKIIPDESIKRLKFHLVSLIGYSFGISSFSKLLPYLCMVENYRIFFRKDPGFNMNKIIENYGGTKSLDEFINSMKIQ